MNSNVVIPTMLGQMHGYYHYDKIEWKNFFKQLKYIDTDISNKTLYFNCKSLSQSKSRDAGFKITRDAAKADVIVIDDYNSLFKDYQYISNKSAGCISRNGEEVEDFFKTYNPSYNYILAKDLYKYLYKYEGNKDLFESCNDLFNSNDVSNIKMAMEFISNANWNGNEIYLKELFYKWWNGYGIGGMRHSGFRHSISFKGFLNSLDFNYESISLSDANDYRKLCENEEHHQWVFKKFEDKFKLELQSLFKKHKIKIDKLEYSIDK